MKTKQISKERSNELLEKRLAFVVKYKELFDQLDLSRESLYLTPIGKDLVEKARIEIGYSSTYIPMDLFNSLLRAYKVSINYEGVRIRKFYGAPAPKIKVSKERKEELIKQQTTSIQNDKQKQILKELNLEYLIK